MTARKSPQRDISLFFAAEEGGCYHEHCSFEEWNRVIDIGYAPIFGIRFGPVRLIYDRILAKRGGDPVQLIF